MMQIMLMPNAIPLQNGATVTIQGSGFPCQSNGTIQSTDGTTLATYVSDKNGCFKVTLTYSKGSSLYNCIIQNQVRNFINIYAWDNNLKSYSEVDELYY